MRTLQFILFQMDEAKRYLLDGSLPALRIALILLDNAAELILDRWITGQIAQDDLRQRIQERLRDVPLPPEFEQRINEISSNIRSVEHAEPYNTRFLTREERKNVARKFPCKVWYVTDIKHALPPLISEVLLHLHRYRNDAHHSAYVRPQTLKISVMIFLELCCQLLTSLRPSSLSMGSSDNFSWLKRRFGVNPTDLFYNYQLIMDILADLREGLPIGDISMREVLAEHLEYRIEDVIEGLDFISKTLRIDRATALTRAQEFTLAYLEQEQPYENVPRNLDHPVSLGSLEALRETARRIRRVDDYVTAFKIYARTDITLERIEYMVNQLVWEIDRWIDMQIEEMSWK